jgi:hemoglobin/transferrin/lactoferrin receptor protein
LLLKKNYLHIILTFIFIQSLLAQKDTMSQALNLDEVVISINKVEESKRTVAQQIRSVSSQEISQLNAQNAGDLLSATGLVMVQKSQQGGSSPILRGFEASRVLLVIDGVRMNNLIYRAGHLQNIITIDQNMLERAEIVFGPSSTVYGSDALGGVVHFHTKMPTFSTNESKHLLLKANVFVRLAAANNEKTSHIDFNIGGKRLALLSSINYSDFGDLRMGKQTQALDTLWGLRKFYAENVNGKDVLTRNEDIYLQKFSGYTQYDFLQKISLKVTDKLTLGLNAQFSNSSNVPRYDRLTDPKGTGLNQAEWYYGPQKRLLAIFDAKWVDETAFFQRITFNQGFQDLEESRHTRTFGHANRTSRIENVNVYSSNLDFQHYKDNHNVRLGLDVQQSEVKSTAFLTSISTGIKTLNGASTRYPDGGNAMLNLASYFTHTWKINDIWTLNEGLRIGMANLQSTFLNKNFYKFPFSEAKQKNATWSGNIGIIYSPNNAIKLSALTATGYRVPNVDDLTKIFDTKRGTVVVPNPDLQPERTWNSELGIAKKFGETFGFEGSLYYTMFNNAILVDKFNFNGADSILYDGVKSAVYAPQNKQKATLWGVSCTVKGKIIDDLQYAATYNYTQGRVAATGNTAATPLDHIPPAFGRISLNYAKNGWRVTVFSSVSAWKRIKDYRIGTEDNELYATKDGMPSWWTLNTNVGYTIADNLTLQIGIDNILDIQYRVFASGIHASGRNIWGAVRCNLK